MSGEDSSILPSFKLHKFRIFVIPLYEFSKDLKMTGISVPLKALRNIFQTSLN